MAAPGCLSRSTIEAWASAQADQVRGSVVEQLAREVLFYMDELSRARDALEGEFELNATPLPIPMLLVCPECGERHVDEGEFATKAHHTHACQHCGMVWRPAIVATVGVRFLPGFKNEAG